MVSRGQIKLIHLAKGRLGLSQEEYVEILLLFGGVRSSKELDPEGFFRVMEHFRELGFEAHFSGIFAPPGETHKKPGVLIEMVTPGQRALIRQLESELGWADNPARLENFIIKRFSIKRIRTKVQAIKVIEALKAMLERKGREGSEAG